MRERAIGGVESPLAEREEATDRAECEHPTDEAAAGSRHEGRLRRYCAVTGSAYGQQRVNIVDRSGRSSLAPMNIVDRSGRSSLAPMNILSTVPGARLGHEPALDGLRGLAVAGVVAFHAGFGWATGGFLGVSTFFTLSGFLITSLLLAERSGTGRIDLVAFWARRARRLLPAALLTLLGVSALAGALASPEQLDGLRGDVLSALFYGANWRFLASGQSYGDLFAMPSPVLHFWSLAIEEQLYVAFPLLVVAVRRRLGAVLVALVVASVVLAWILYEPGGSTSAAYYGTGVRAGELLVGALLAMVVARRRDLVRSPAVAVAGTGALALLLWAWTVVRQDELVLFRGGLVAHAVVSALVIAACLAPGPVRSMLSLSPLQALGRISYGVYLYHWPVLLWFDAPLLLQLAVTLVLAMASFVLVEQPIRLGTWRVPAVAVPVGALLVAGAVVVSTADPPAPRTFDLAASNLPAAPAVDAAPGAPRVAMFGDSTALRTGFALKGWGWTTGRIDMRQGGADVGCPLARGGVVDFVAARVEPEPHCDEWPAAWLALARGLDAAVVQVGPWDVTDRRLDGTWTHIGEPAFDALLEREMHLAVDVLSADGALVLWLTSPVIDFGRGQTGLPRDHPISDPRRMARFNELITTVDAARDEMVVVDLAAHLRSLPGGELDPDLRPDGVHFSEESSKEIAEWLAPLVIDLVRGRSSSN